MGWPAPAEAGHRRALATVFGEVTVTRIAYRAPGAANLCPADAALNLPREKHSHGLRKLAAIESARGSFEQAGQAISRVTGVGLGKRQAEQLAQAAAADVDAFCAARRPGRSAADVVLVMSYDGKGIVMRPDALREVTAKAAAGTRRKLATRLSPGEKNGRKRMAELAAVCDAAPAPRAPADIIARPGKDTARMHAPGPAATGKWLTASVTDDIPAVIAAGFAEADRRDPGRQRTWVALVDGNRQQIEVIEAEAARRGVTVTIVCDLVHVLEYLWKAAWSFFGPGDPGAEEWVAAQATKILEGKAAQAAASIRRRASLFGYSPAERAGADACAAYLTAKRPYLDYATALQRGWPIATGVIEGACRHIVADRMDITDARWGLAGAETVLKLRALIVSGDFGDYWTWHLQQEHQRIHQARYRDRLTLAA